jgi:hypothetical protein
MIDKKSTDGIRCVFCGAPATAGTNPPVCSDHLKLNKTAEDMDTLDSIEQDDRIWNRG